MSKLKNLIDGAKLKNLKDLDGRLGHVGNLDGTPEVPCRVPKLGEIQTNYGEYGKVQTEFGKVETRRGRKSLKDDENGYMPLIEFAYFGLIATTIYGFAKSLKATLKYEKSIDERVEGN